MAYALRRSDGAAPPELEVARSDRRPLGSERRCGS